MKALPPRVQIDEQDGFVKPCLIQKHSPYRAQNFGETLLKTSWLLGSDLRRSIRSLRPDLIDTLQRSKLNGFLDQSSVQRIFLRFGIKRTPLFRQLSGSTYSAQFRFRGHCISRFSR